MLKSLVVALVVVFIVSTGVVSAWAEEFPCSKTSSFPSFQLSASETCRAWIRIQEARIQEARIQETASQDTKLCLNQNQWQEWLTRIAPPALCGTLQGHWKLSAPLSEESLTEPKVVRPSFRLSLLPQESQAQASHALRHFGLTLWQRLQRFRESISDRLKPWDDWGVFRALVLGETTPASPHEFLRVIGFFHLLNASGVHLYALALVTNAACAFLLEKAQISVGLAIGVSRAFSVALWIWAWLLCGCRPGMLRPAFVAGSRLLATSLGFQWRYWAPFALSFLLELILGWSHHQPLLSESRLEIALSVGGFLLAVQDQDQNQSPQKGSARLVALRMLGGWIFVALAQAFRNHLIPLSAPILSALTLPVFCTLIYPWILFESLLCPQTWIGNLFLSVANRFLHFLVALSLSVPSLWMISSAALLTALLLALMVVTFSFRLSLAKRLAIAGAAALALLAARETAVRSRTNVSYAHFPPQETAREVIQLDVGQGDSALVLSGSGSGTGPGPSSERAGLIDAGSARALNDAQWIESFAQEGVSELNWVALTHLDEDHRGGLDRLTRLLPIRCVASSQEEISSPRGEKLARQLLARGTPLQSWEAGCVPFPVHRPNEGAHRQTSQKKSGNLAMSALLVPLQSGDIYLSAGDAEGEDEIEIFKWANEHAASARLRILKVSHHGSRTSSAVQALEAFHPDVAIISVGLGNTYGHPSQEVLDRFSVMKIPVFRTDQFGAIRAEAFLHPQQARRP